MIIITPLDQQMYMKQLESKYGGSIYDRSNQPLKGWSAERQQAENNTIVSKDQSETTVDEQKPVIVKSWFAKLGNMFITPRLPTENSKS